MTILSDTLKKLYNAIDIETLQKRAEIMNGFERNYGQANFKKSAYCCQQFMLAAGLQNVQMLPIPCDGVSTFGDYIIPQAWDRTGRSFLQIEDKKLSYEDAMICDTDKTPFAAGMWSMPTPPEGVHAEIVDWEALDKENPDVEGKFVLITFNSYRKAYLYCVEHNAAAIIVSDSAAPKETYDEIRWSNGIGRIGWYHTKDDKRGVIFCITPRKADFIRSLLAKGKPVKAYGVMNTKVYDDELYTVTGIVPGADKKEVLLIAHIYEPFVADDAAGGGADGTGGEDERRMRWLGECGVQTEAREADCCQDRAPDHADEVEDRRGRWRSHLRARRRGQRRSDGNDQGGVR